MLKNGDSTITWDYICTLWTYFFQIIEMQFCVSYIYGLRWIVVCALTAHHSEGFAYLPQKWRTCTVLLHSHRTCRFSVSEMFWQDFIWSSIFTYRSVSCLQSIDISAAAAMFDQLLLSKHNTWIYSRVQLHMDWNKCKHVTKMHIVCQCWHHYSTMWVSDHMNGQTIETIVVPLH